MLWDVDYTLLRAGRVGPALYRLALQEMFGCDLPSVTVSMAGRTDRAIAVDVLLAAGIADPRAVLDQFQAVLARHAPALAEQVATYGRVLPGVREALAAVAAGRPGVRVVQSALTGNLRAMAEVKLAALGLTEYLDVDAGAYGEQSEVRADLVPVARRNAAARYGADFSGEATVLVGDTPLDIEAALAAGAHAALPDLTDLPAAVAAILP